MYDLSSLGRAGKKVVSIYIFKIERLLGMFDIINKTSQSK